MDSYSDCCCMSGLAGLQAGFYADNARSCEIIDAPYYLNKISLQTTMNLPPDAADPSGVQCAMLAQGLEFRVDNSF